MGEWTRSRRSALAGVLAVMAVVLGATGAASGQDAAAAPCEPGAAGVGDDYFPNYGNGGYDVRKYDLNVSYDPATDVLDGRAVVHARTTQSLCSFDFDLDGMTVRGIDVDDKPATFSRDGQELIVTPKKPLADGQRFDAAVTYDGVPKEFAIPGTTLRTGFMATPEGATVAGQPEVAAGWFPVNDHPIDKAAYSFKVTVPDGFEVAANGFLRNRVDHGDETTWEWAASEPMASYLATIDIADWDVTEGETDDGLPQYDAVDTNITGGLRDEIDDSFSRQGEILEMLSDAFGPYPFSTVGGIVPNQNDLRFALETQTRPVYSKRFWLTSQGVPRDADWVVVHELAHQWYGDDVAVERWQHIWLNEGFASYAEWLWEEHEGRATPQEIFQATYDEIPADDPFWSVVIGDPGVTDLFSDPVYIRGAMTLQALRNEVGDAAFFEILHRWASEQSGGNGNTEEFTSLAEEVSGQDLDELFNTWLFTGEKPPASAVSGGDAAVSAKAEQSAERQLQRTQRLLAEGAY
jgi:aminopeptidase N